MADFLERVLKKTLLSEKMMKQLAERLGIRAQEMPVGRSERRARERTMQKGKSSNHQT